MFGNAAHQVPTFVDTVFGGSLVSTITCKECHNVREWKIHSQSRLSPPVVSFHHSLTSPLFLSFLTPLPIFSLFPLFPSILSPSLSLSSSVLHFKRVIWISPSRFLEIRYHQQTGHCPTITYLFLIECYFFFTGRWESSAQRSK